MTEDMFAVNILIESTVETRCG